MEAREYIQAPPSLGLGKGGRQRALNCAAAIAGASLRANN